MKPGTECDRVRIQRMAALDGESVADAAAPGPAVERHLASCSSCREWLATLESMNGRLQPVAYPRAEEDLWTAVERRIVRQGTAPSVTQRLWLIGALLLAWRALQLLVDLPFPELHAVVPLAAAIAALWQIAGDPLAVETFAPELQKRGV